MTPRRPVEPLDITRIRWVSDPDCTPDGTRVAFVVTTLSEERDEYLSSIWAVGAGAGSSAVDGQHATPPGPEHVARRFTTGPARDTAPRWSPDGRWLAFLSERDGKKKAQLYLIPADGGESRRLTDFPHGVSNPVWSPDSTRLAFAARVGGPTPEEEAAAIQKQTSRPVRIVTTLKSKLNGEGFIHDRRPHVFVVPIDGGAPVQITEGDFTHADPAWSPDGEWIAFSSARHDERDLDDGSDVWIVAAKGGDARQVTDTSGVAVLPVFSPDGSTVAYVGRHGKNVLGGNLRLFATPVAGGPARCLTAGLDRSILTSMSPIWRADGSIVFAIESEGDASVWRVRADDDAPAERLVGGTRWVTGLSASSDGRRLAFTATDPIAPAEVFILDGADERPITDLNAEWKAGVELPAPERFRIRRDGVDVDGWVMRPAGLTEGRRYPTLVNVHGGPHTQYGHTFFDEFQVYAGAGYAVVFLNPRGSQGYGEAFTRAVVGDWGGIDFADLMAVVDEALRRFAFLDGERLGLMGGSYGGFLTSWAVGHTDRFKAACSERAVNNQLTMFGTSDIGHWFQVAETGGPLPWEDPQRWIERSPVTHASRILTPLLIIHSENDLRCPISEAEQLFVALKMLGRDVVFARFPDENHELSRSGKPRHRLERFRIILDWFARKL